MNVDPKVSIVLAFFNGRNTISSALRSLTMQTFQDWELIAIDDCSQDNSAEIVAQLEDPRVRLYRNSSNLGLSASLNRGIDLARAPYIARMDCDDLCMPRRLEIQHAFMRKHSDLDLIGGQAIMFRGDGEAIGVLDAPVSQGEIAKKLRFGGTPLYHPAWFGRTEWFRHFYYKDAFLKGQDFELLIRAASCSKYSNVPDLILGYRREETDFSKRISSRKFVLRAYRDNFAKGLSLKDFVLGTTITGAKIFYDLMKGFSKSINAELKVTAIHDQWLSDWNELQQKLSFSSKGTQ